jgi:hypothetical protein
MREFCDGVTYNASAQRIRLLAMGGRGGFPPIYLHILNNNRL